MPSHPAYNYPPYRKEAKRLKQAARTGTPIPCALSGPRCKGIATQPHHIIPVLKGGGWGSDNLMPACSWCNIWESAKARKRARLKQRNLPQPAGYYE